jgi:hypothetical protein
MGSTELWKNRATRIACVTRAYFSNGFRLRQQNHGRRTKTLFYHVYAVSPMYVTNIKMHAG